MTDADTIVLPRLGSPEAIEDPWGEGHGETSSEPPSDTRWLRLAAWLVPALLMGAFGVAGAAPPGLHMEKLATWGGGASSWRDTWSMLRWEDAAPYHLLGRAWMELIGTSELALRGPCVLAMATAAALVGATAARMFTPGTGVLAGVIFALLPTTVRYAQEAQPYALTLLAAVLATWLLQSAVDRPGPWRLVLYAAAVGLLGLCNVIALLLLVGHGWAVLAFRREVALRWLAAAVVGVLPAAGLLWHATQQGTRLAQASSPSLTGLAAMPGQLFGVAALGAVLLALALFSLPLRYPAAVFTAGAVVPLLVLLLVAQATPIWPAELLHFTLPAWATLGGAGLAYGARRVRCRR